MSTTKELSMNNAVTSLEATLRNFILENYLFSDDETLLSNEQSFLESGILDSMGILELITFLDEELAIKVEASEMVPANLDSINNLLAFIAKKTA